MLIKEISNYYLFDGTDILTLHLNPKYAYYERKIIQKNKKERRIYIPNDVVKSCQKYVLDTYLSSIKYHESATAYTKGKSIVTNAFIHKDNTYFLHLDIKHFFDDMKWDIFCKLVHKFFPDSHLSKLIKDDEEELKMLLLYKDAFVQGSVTAPYISNIYLYEFDIKMKELVSIFPNGRYSRYSDDIYISSSSYIDDGVIEKVSSLLKDYKLRLNYKKIKFYKLNSAVNITGVSITNDHRLTLSTLLKKEMKTQFYKLLKSNGRVKKHDLFVLHGKLCFIKMVDLNYYNYLQTKYSKDGYALDDYISDLFNKLS